MSCSLSYSANVTTESLMTIRPTLGYALALPGVFWLIATKLYMPVLFWYTELTSIGPELIEIFRYRRARIHERPLPFRPEELFEKTKDAI